MSSHQIPNSLYILTKFDDFVWIDHTHILYWLQFFIGHRELEVPNPYILQRFACVCWEWNSIGSKVLFEFNVILNKHKRCVCQSFELRLQRRSFNFCFRGQDGQKYPQNGKFRNVVVMFSGHNWSEINQDIRNRNSSWISPINSEVDDIEN